LAQLEQQDLELRVQQEFKEQQVLRALLDCKVLLERQELLVDKDQQGQLVSKVVREPQEPQALLDLREPQEQLGHKGQQG
jgi:hypothetical protein